MKSIALNLAVQLSASELILMLNLWLKLDFIILQQERSPNASGGLCVITHYW